MKSDNQQHQRPLAVDKAVRDVVRRYLRERLAERVLTGNGIDRSPELLAKSRPSLMTLQQLPDTGDELGARH